MGELPELRDAMSLVWRILLLWLAVMALFVVAGGRVSRPDPAWTLRVRP